MKYLTAIEASKRIGVAEKTIRLWVKQGKLEAHHPAKNRLAIAEADVERMAQERQLYYGTRPEMSSSTHTLPDASVHDDIEQRLASMAQSIANLNATIDIQSRRLNELTKRVAELEARNVPTQPVPPSTTADTIPQPKPQIATTAINSLPDGCILARDFARMHGVPESSFRRHIASGIGGDMVEAGSSKHGRYLTPEQQEATLEFWQRHNVKFTRLE
ncbi:MAG TPA: helix-turn-helix domain-containing protein [Ktedonobacteraceae bacterium]|jgi:DNA-binding transcriptional MerR regulator|nr:helix-turn-helix domain-containing protein [Ktedonobacteraceae bacterium]